MLRAFTTYEMSCATIFYKVRTQVTYINFISWYRVQYFGKFCIRFHCSHLYFISDRVKVETNKQTNLRHTDRQTDVYVRGWNASTFRSILPSPSERILNTPLSLFHSLVPLQVGEVRICYCST